MEKAFLLICSTLFITSLLVACNTVRGIGQDIQSGGRIITNAAD